jgi:hypothetical protein
LDFREQKGEVAVNFVVALQDTGGLDTFPGRGDLDEDAGLVDSNGLVELRIFSLTFTYESIDLLPQ